MAGGARIFPLDGEAALQDPRPDPARTLPPLRPLPHLRRRQAQARGAQRARRGNHYCGGREGGNLIRAGAPPRARIDKRAKGAKVVKHAKGARSENAGTPGRVMLMRTLSRERRFTKRDPALRIVGAREHNLKGLDVRIPLGRMVCVTGVSGSGKSTLVEDVLYNNYLRRRGEPVSDVGACDRIEGLELVGEMVHMGQELPARSLRSNPATYLKIYDDIRRLFAQSNEARRLGIQPRHFSFNVEGGRCEKCHGTGTVTIEHHLEFIAHADYVIDLGPGGGDDGGRVVAAGPPLKVAAAARSLTGRELRGLFGLPASAPRAAARSAKLRASAG